MACQHTAFLVDIFGVAVAVSDMIILTRRYVARVKESQSRVLAANIGVADTTNFTASSRRRRNLRKGGQRVGQTKITPLFFNGKKTKQI